MVHVPLMFLSEWREFPSAPCPAGKKKSLTVRVSMLLKSRASPDMFPFNLRNKKRLAIQHMNRPLFPPTLSIPSYDIGKQVGQRTYKHPSRILNLHYATVIQQLIFRLGFWGMRTDLLPLVFTLSQPIILIFEGELCELFV